MDKLFLTILNMSLTGAFVITAICVARLTLKKAPKIISYCLWAVAGFRLVFPYSIESVFSLIPFKAQTIPPDIAMQPIPRIDSGISFVNNAVSSILTAATTTASVNSLQIWTTFGAWVWIVGVAVLLIYGVVSFFILKQKMCKAVHTQANIYEAENIKSPFVLGVIKPRIYMPIGLSAQEKSYIILHEKTHIRRHDHIVKFAAYFVLCLHWFNPLVWAAFLLMGVDMEMSCDERVLKQMGGETKKDYSLSLLSLATERRIIGGSPLAFGEGGVKARIKNVLNFKKPSRMIVVAAVALVAILSVGFAVNRVQTDDYISADIAMKQLINSIECANGNLLFQVPADYPQAENWNIIIVGREEFEDGFNMSAHFFEEENQNHAWIAGMQYSIVIEGRYFTDLLMDVSLPDEMGNIIEESIDLLSIINTSALLSVPPTIPEKTPLLDVNLVTLDIYGNSQMQISRDVRAAQLTNDWYVVDENGDGFGYSADSFHPLQKQDGYGDVTLNLNNSGVITLLFSDNYPPQSVSVQRWNAEYAGTDSTDIWNNGEPINVMRDTFQVSDDGNDYIYEVYAKWSEGDSWYVFRIDR